MEHQLGTILTQNNRPTFGRLSKAYVGLTFMPTCGGDLRTTTLEHFGTYEVRLVEFLQNGPTEDCLFWLELFCHVTQYSRDSCRCDNLDDAETAADHLLSCAKRLHDGDKCE